MRAQIFATLVAVAILFGSAPAWAQMDEPMPPPAPEGEVEEPRAPTLPPPPTARPAGTTAAATAATTVDKPVERADAGLWGFAWRFSGLATMATAGTSRSHPLVSGVSLMEAMVKYTLSEEWRIPFHAGTLLAVSSPSGGEASTTWGLALGGGFERHFHIWRRISPFIGADMTVGVLDPSGASNWAVGIGLGPIMGIEYFLADRISLSAIYAFLIQFWITDPQFDFSMQTMSGGSAVLTAYF